jgi:demethylmenaquinone methyltransferase/2-methoxy-6-polyprenyl-1,4-benzoquinol methylase
MINKLMSSSLGNSALARLLLKLVASDSQWRQRLMDPRRVLQGAKVQAGQTILEVGCGQGFFTLPAADMVGPAGCIYALDVTAAAVDYVAQKAAAAGVTNIRPVKADALTTSLPDAAMDLVLLFGVIPSPTLHLSRLLPEMWRVLKPAGALAVWTAVPLWTPKFVTTSGLFAYAGKANEVYTFERVGKS